MTRKKERRESNSLAYINGDLTLLRAETATKLRAKDDLKAVSMLTEKTIVYDDDGKNSSSKILQSSTNRMNRWL